MILTGGGGGQNLYTPTKICPSATLSATNPTWTDLYSTLDFHDETPASNLLIHGIIRGSMISI
jgi:hypothetical protein